MYVPNPQQRSYLFLYLYLIELTTSAKQSKYFAESRQIYLILVGIDICVHSEVLLVLLADQGSILRASVTKGLSNVNGSLH